MSFLKVLIMIILRIPERERAGIEKDVSQLRQRSHHFTCCHQKYTFIFCIYDQIYRFNLFTSHSQALRVSRVQRSINKGQHYVLQFHKLPILDLKCAFTPYDSCHRPDDSTLLCWTFKRWQLSWSEFVKNWTYQTGRRRPPQSWQWRTSEFGHRS